MEFNLDDIYDLTIRNKRHIDDFSIDSFDKICSENVKLLADLIEYSQKKCEEINDKNIKRAMLNGTKNNLIRAYNKMQTIKPKQEYNELPKSYGSNVGYFKEHPDAIFVEKRFPDLTNVYSSVIDFMNWIYGGYKVATKKGVNPKPIYEIFEQTKIVCSKLGVRSLDADTLCDAFSNPNSELAINLDIDTNFDEENSLINDVAINSLPYVFDCPAFSATDGMKLYICHAKKGMVWYNESYIKRQGPIL